MRELSPHYDTDLLDAWEMGGEAGFRDALAQRCQNCGHAREDHLGSSGALASFGGSACELCWTCPTFLKPRPLLHESVAVAGEQVRKLASDIFDVRDGDEVGTDVG